MDRRLELHQVLVEVLGDSDAVHFQPPANVAMTYPAIVYERDRGLSDYAGNLPYRHERRYQLTLIDRDPDSVFYDKIVSLPKCSHDRHFKADNLNHDVFTIYF